MDHTRAEPLYPREDTFSMEHQIDRPDTTPGSATTSERSDSSPSVAIVASAMGVVIVLWGLGPPVTKLISAPPLVGASIRFWIVLPLVWMVCYLKGSRMSLRILRITMPAGIFFGLNQVFVFAALPHVTISVISVILAMQPGVVLILAGPLLGERPTKWHVMWTMVGLVGVTIVLLGGGADVEASPFGVTMTVGALLGFALYYVITRRVLTDSAAVVTVNHFQWMAGTTLTGAAIVTAMALVTMGSDDYGQFGGPDWLYMAFVAVGVGVVSHTMMSWCHQHITVSRSSLYILAMHVVAIGTAWPMHDEPMALLQMLGAVIVLGAVAAVVSLPPIQVRPIGITELAGGPDSTVDNPSDDQGHD